jgi:hypothetical protein
MTETIILSAIGAAGMGLAALGILAWVRGNRRRNSRHFDSAGSAPPLSGPEQEVPLARYQPMFRLLEGADTEFLRRRQSDPQITRVWARSQRKVVRLYLKELAEDFGKLHREARIQVAQSAEAPPQAMLRLFRQQLAFRRALLWIEMRLWLGGAGVPRINPEALVVACEALQREISRGTRIAGNQPA